MCQSVSWLDGLRGGILVQELLRVRNLGHIALALEFSLMLLPQLINSVFKLGLLEMGISRGIDL